MNPRSPKLTVFSLAAAHLWHEWVLTFCLIAALAAVIAPLLVLLGLKEGTIATLRDRLVEDPIYREIKPAATRSFEVAWFDGLKADPRTAFVIPTILPASSVIHLGLPGDEGEMLDLVPTGAGDPLLLENGGVIPGPDGCVLTADAARRVGVRAGGRVQARITRSRGGRMESVTLDLGVAAVLEPRAGGLARVYAPLGLVVDVEAYKEGRAVPARGWDGDSPIPYLSYEGAILITGEALDPITRTALVVNTGLLDVATLTATEVRERLGIALPAARHAYRLSLPSGTVTQGSIQALARKLRGRDALLLPDAGPLNLIGPDGTPVPAVGLSLAPQQAKTLGLPELPWGRWDPDVLDATRLNRALWPGRDADGLPVRFEGVAPLTFELGIVGASPGGQALIPAELAGLLRTARERRVSFEDAGAGQTGFVLERPGFRGFRLYAASIDHIPALAAELRAQGIEVIAEVAAIERIRTLDRGLTRLFWLIALLGVGGGCAVLVASLYAAVERERRDLGVLRLIGLARAHVFWFPIFQGGIIALLGVGAGVAGYAGIGRLINRTFGQDLAPGEAVCRLPGEYIGLALAAALTLAVASSLVAAWHATGIDPAEAIREE